jgi:hypothetical protein
MAQVTPNMQLTVWNLSSDTYNYEQLADNFIKIDQHDHNAIGKKIGSGALLDGSVTSGKLAADSVTSNAIAADSVGSSAIASNAVGSSEIADNAVTTTKIATGNTYGIQTANIADGVVTRIKLASGLVPNLVTTLPSGNSLFDGYEVYYVADANNSIVWHLRYQAGDNGTVGRWQFLGGRPALSLQPQNNYSGSESIVPPKGRSIDGSWRSFASINLPKGYYTITISGHGNIAWTNTASATIANAQFQMGFLASSATTLTASTGTVTFNLIPYSQRTWFEAPITKTTTDLGMPVSHTALFDSTSDSVSSATPIQLYARRTTTSTEDASSNTTSGYFSKGIITATPIYLKAS